MSYHNDHDEDAVEEVKTIPVASTSEDSDDTTSESSSSAESEADSTSDEESAFLSDSIADTDSPSASDSDSDPGPDPATNIARAAAMAAAASGPKLADRLAAFLPQLAAANASLSAEEISKQNTDGGVGFEIEEEDEEDNDDTIDEDSDDDSDNDRTLSDDDDQEEEEEVISHHPAIIPESSDNTKAAKSGRTKKSKRRQPYIEMSLDLGILEATTGGDGQLVENARLGLEPETEEEPASLVKDGVRIPLKRDEADTDTAVNGIQTVAGAAEEQHDEDGDGILDSLLHPTHATGPSRKKRKMAKVGIVEVA
jgi:hypothetical protein